MFLENSRYAPVSQVAFKTRSGREVLVVKLRRLPSTAGASYVVQGTDRLDILAHKNYADSTRAWHIADANTELESGELTSVAGRTIKMPEQQ